MYVYNKKSVINNIKLYSYRWTSVSENQNDLNLKFKSELNS